MTTRELQAETSDATFVAKVRSTPTGEIELDTGDGDVDVSVYGPIEIVWYPDRLEITAVGAGPASITETYLSDGGEDLIVEVRPPRADELPDFVPGAD